MLGLQWDYWNLGFSKQGRLEADTGIYDGILLNEISALEGKSPAL